MVDVVKLVEDARLWLLYIGNIVGSNPTIHPPQQDNNLFVVWGISNLEINETNDC